MSLWTGIILVVISSPFWLVGLLLKIGSLSRKVKTLERENEELKEKHQMLLLGLPRETVEDFQRDWERYQAARLPLEKPLQKNARPTIPKEPVPEGPIMAPREAVPEKPLLVPQRAMENREAFVPQMNRPSASVEAPPSRMQTKEEALPFGPLFTSSSPTKEKEGKKEKKEQSHLAGKWGTRYGPVITLCLGAFFVMLSGLVFATTTWRLIPGFMKIGCLVLFAIILFFSSYIAQNRLKIYLTAKTFYGLGAIYLFVSVIAAGYFRLFGEYFSIPGEGRYYVYFFATLLSEIAFIYGLHLFKGKWYAFLCLFGVSICYFLLTYAFFNEGKNLTASFAVFAGVLAVGELLGGFRERKLPAIFSTVQQVATSYVRMNMLLAAAMGIFLLRVDWISFAACLFLFFVFIFLLQKEKSLPPLWENLYGGLSLGLLVLGAFRMPLHLVYLDFMLASFLLLEVAGVFPAFGKNFPKKIQQIYTWSGIVFLIVLALVCVYLDPRLFGRGNFSELMFVSGQPLPYRFWFRGLGMLLVLVHTFYLHRHFQSKSFGLFCGGAVFATVVTFTHIYQYGVWGYTLLCGFAALFTQISGKGEKEGDSGWIGKAHAFLRDYSPWNILYAMVGGMLIVQKSLSYFVLVFLIWLLAFWWAESRDWKHRMNGTVKTVFALCTSLYLPVVVLLYFENIYLYALREVLWAYLAVLLFYWGMDIIPGRSREFRRVYSYSTSAVGFLLYCIALFYGLTARDQGPVLLSFFVLLLYVHYAQHRFWKQNISLVKGILVQSMLYIALEKASWSIAAFVGFMCLWKALELTWGKHWENPPIWDIRNFIKYFGDENVLLAGVLAFWIPGTGALEAGTSIIAALLLLLTGEREKNLSRLERDAALLLSSLLFLGGIFRWLPVQAAEDVLVGLMIGNVFFAALACLPVLESRTRSFYKISSFVVLGLLYAGALYSVSEWEAVLPITLGAFAFVVLHSSFIAVRYEGGKLRIWHGAVCVSLVQALLSFLGINFVGSLVGAGFFSSVMVMLRRKLPKVELTKDGWIFYLVHGGFVALLVVIMEGMVELAFLSPLCYYLFLGIFLAFIVIRKQFMEEYPLLQYGSHILELGFLAELGQCLALYHGIDFPIEIFWLLYLSGCGLYHIYKKSALEYSLLGLALAAGMWKWGVDENGLALSFLWFVAFYIQGIFLRGSIRKIIWDVVSVVCFEAGLFLLFDLIYLPLSTILLLLAFSGFFLYIVFEQKVAKGYLGTFFKPWITALLLLAVLSQGLAFPFGEVNLEMILLVLAVLLWYSYVYFIRENLYSIFAALLVGLLQWRIYSLFPWEGEWCFVITGVILAGMQLAFRQKSEVIEKTESKQNRVDWLNLFSPCFLLLPLLWYLPGRNYLSLYFVFAALYLRQLRILPGFQKHWMTASGFCLLLAIWVQNLSLLPGLIQAEIYVGAFGAYIFALQFIYPQVPLVQRLQIPCYTSCLLILGVLAVAENDLINSLILEGIYIFFFLIAFWRKHKWMLRITCFLAVLFVLYMTRVYWLAFGWWLGLLLGGMALIFFAATSEKKKK